jgi:hypothetical protein
MVSRASPYSATYEGVANGGRALALSGWVPHEVMLLLARARMTAAYDCAAPGGLRVDPEQPTVAGASRLAVSALGCSFAGCSGQDSVFWS